MCSIREKEGAMGFSAIGMVLLAGVLAVSRPALAQTPGQAVAPGPAAPETEDTTESTAPDTPTPEAPRPDARPPGAPPPPEARPPAAPPRPEARPPVPDREPAGRPSGPGIRLVGVILGEGKPPVALIEIARTRQQALYRVGDEILEARVEQIFEDRAILRYQNQPLELRLTGGASGSPPAGQPPASASAPAGSAGPRGPESTARLLELARRLRDNPNDTAAAE